MRISRTLLALSMTSVLALTACGGEAEEVAAEPTTAAETSDAEAAEETSEDMDDDMDDDMDTATEDAMGDPAANLVGAGCADYAAAVPDGAGSVAGMAQDPVAVAASNNPLLTTLVAAVSGQVNPDVDLVDTLNGDEFTVFAPVDDAFAQIDAETMGTLEEDADLLSSILTYHVVPGQLTPEQVVGEQTTVQGGTVEVAGSGDELTVNGATVICGGVQTANATVYLIDEVLMPQG
ncbi:fasciclin domain-containing protein [Ornithinimicrobium cerasi]|uniref:Uncaracterized surface protein containing fasciclin (FAS1) repeats n=1 Tax=Ornithinimicrobium cerasi TaxID=2248773 RepID=A0A285VLQ2_9MICO|nr:fasciclin domain-containing protein [Ornithinimicrobium cerasi]SOC55014.1 Uncaracterized surface protein containing fasciclin (FAS1) repeats [Ornithinimicrobium cerasi]